MSTKRMKKIVAAAIVNSNCMRNDGGMYVERRKN